MYDVIIIGAGGHAKVVADLVLKTGNRLLGFLDDNKDMSEKVLGYGVLGRVKNCFGYNAGFVIGIGGSHERKRIAERYGLDYIALIHPSAQVGIGVEIGEGTVVMANAVVNSGTRIGGHCIINSGAVVEHDNRIGDFVHVSPNASLGGDVSVKELTHIGIGAAVKNGVSICGGCTVGAGAVVVGDINESGTYVGVPAKRPE